MKNKESEYLNRVFELILMNLPTVIDIINKQEPHLRSHEPEPLMTRKAAAEYLKIESSTLSSWTKKEK